MPLGVVEIAGEAQHPFAFTTVQLTAAEAGRLVFVAAGLQAVVGFVAQSTRLAGGPRTTVVTTGCTYTGQRIAGDSIRGGRDVGDAALAAGIADRVVGDAAAGVLVPRSTAETTARGADIGDGHVRGAPGIGADRDGAAFAVGSRGVRRSAYLSLVNRDAVDLRLQGNCR